MSVYFKFELKRALFSLKTLAALFLIMICLLIPHFSKSAYGGGRIDGLNYFIELGNDGYLSFFAPIISCIPFSYSYTADSRKHILSKLFENTDPKEYFKSKIISNALASGFVFLTAQILVLIFSCILFGINNINKLDPAGAFATIYNHSKIAYVSILLLVSAISAGAFSTFLLGASAVTKSRLLIYILPIAYTVITGIAFIREGFSEPERLNVLSLFNLTTSYASSGMNVIVYDLLLFTAGFILFYYFAYKKLCNLIQ